MYTTMKGVNFSCILPGWKREMLKTPTFYKKILAHIFDVVFYKNIQSITWESGFTTNSLSLTVLWFNI